MSECLQSLATCFMFDCFTDYQIELTTLVYFKLVPIYRRWRRYTTKNVKGLKQVGLYIFMLRKGGIKRLQAKMDSSKVTPKRKAITKKKQTAITKKKSNKNRTDKNFM